MPESGGQIRGLLTVLLTEGVFPFMHTAYIIPLTLTLDAALRRWVPPEQTCLLLNGFKGTVHFLV